MSVTKANGNMYPWVTHCHTHLRGACPHACPYCYASKGRAGRFYQGELRLKLDELQAGYGNRENKPCVYFIEHMFDLFAAPIPTTWISQILGHCRQVQANTYVFQTRNVQRARGFLDMMPDNRIIGTTIETDLPQAEFCGCAPDWTERLYEIGSLAAQGEKTYITIEPVMRFSKRFAKRLLDARPRFVNIGADSKCSRLPEPTGDEVDALVCALTRAGMDVRRKPNLKRIIGREVQA